MPRIEYRAESPVLSPRRDRPRFTCSARRPVLRYLAFAIGMGIVGAPALLAGQTARADSGASVSRVTLRFGMSRSVAGFRSEVEFAGGGGPVRHYRVRNAAAVGARLAILQRAAFGVDIDADVIAPVRLAEVGTNYGLGGSTVAVLAALSASYAPRALCEARCVRFAVGPGIGYYQLDEYLEPRAGVSFAVSPHAESVAADRTDADVGRRAAPLADVVMGIGKSQVAFALRAGVEYRLPGRLRAFTLGLTDYMVKFAPDGYGAPGISPLHQVVLSAGITP